MTKKLPKPDSAKPVETDRAFKTAWFAKEARKAKIADEELCHAIRQVMQGQADDLGGGVYKKRLNDNMHRSIIIAKAYMPTSMQKRIARTLHRMNWLHSKSLRKITVARVMPGLPRF